MILLLIFAFLAGIVTVLSPCILPVLPLILSSSVVHGETSHSRPLGVVTGFVVSFTLFTLFLSTLVRLLGISADSLRFFSIGVIALFGLSLLLPAFQMWMEKFFSRLSNLAPRSGSGQGFGSGFIVGMSLGLLWTPCVGPILASVITLALSGNVTTIAFLITLAYAIGTAIPMLLIMWGGRALLMRVPWLLSHTGHIQKGFGAVMLLTAFALATNLDRTFQTFIINTFPQYGVGLTRFEDKDFIREKLEALQESNPGKTLNKAKRMFDLFPKGTLAPELIPGGAWINSEPLSLEALRGKVVIVDFWTYSCINCQRTLPYMRTWHEKYADKGLVIIGVHSPEFEFEKNEKNVRQAVKDFGLPYPVMQDNNFATWRAYANHYWPAKYFIDKDGYVRYSHFGEGDYDKSEEVIQALLEENGAQDISETINNPETTISAHTPETYLGYERLERFGSVEEVRPNQAFTYTAPARLAHNSVAYNGPWTVMGEYASPSEGASLLLSFDAKEVYLVMRPKEGMGKGTVRVFVDGEVQSNGEDVQEGMISVEGDRLYKLVKLSVPGKHLLRLEFLDDHTEVYAFTFG